MLSELAMHATPKLSDTRIQTSACTYGESAVPVAGAHAERETWEGVRMSMHAVHGVCGLLVAKTAACR